jgi:TonB family protein
MMHNTNIKRMKKKPTLSDDEIRAHMDFDNLLKVHQASAGAAFAHAAWIKVSAYTVGALMGISALVYWAWPKDEQPSVNSNTNTNTEVTLADTAIHEAQIETITEATPVSSMPAEEKKAFTEEQHQQYVAQPKAAKPISPTFIEASPIHGYPNLYAYFNRELKYPADALEDSIQGVASVSFAIGIDGKPTEIIISNSLGKIFDEECKRVILNMPPWQPASVNGAAISTRLSIPLTFSISKNK